MITRALASKIWNCTYRLSHEHIVSDLTKSRRLEKIASRAFTIQEFKRYPELHSMTGNLFVINLYLAWAFKLTF